MLDDRDKEKSMSSYVHIERMRDQNGKSGEDRWGCQGAGRATVVVVVVVLPPPFLRLHKVEQLQAKSPAIRHTVLTDPTSSPYLLVLSS